MTALPPEVGDLVLGDGRLLRAVFAFLRGAFPPAGQMAQLLHLGRRLQGRVFRLLARARRGGAQAQDPGRHDRDRHHSHPIPPCSRP